MKKPHTPKLPTRGPWRIEWHDGESFSTEILGPKNPNAIAHVFATDISETARADARLIAAAPGLFAALVEVLTIVESGDHITEQYFRNQINRWESLVSAVMGYKA